MPDQFDLPGFDPPPTPTTLKARELPAPRRVAMNHLFVALFLPAELSQGPALPGGEAFQRFASLGEGLRAQHRLTGKLLGPERLHVTLLDLGSWEEREPPADLVQTVIGALAPLSAPSFDVVFDRALSFSGPPQRRPYVLCGGAGVADLIAFRRELAQAMQGAGVRVARSFTPHMTLLYGPEAVTEHPIDPVCWKPQVLSLVFGVNHRGHRVHQILAHWPLRD